MHNGIVAQDSNQEDKDDDLSELIAALLGSAPPSPVNSLYGIIDTVAEKTQEDEAIAIKAQLAIDFFNTEKGRNDLINLCFADIDIRTTIKNFVSVNSTDMVVHVDKFIKDLNTPPGKELFIKLLTDNSDFGDCINTLVSTQYNGQSDDDGSDCETFAIKLGAVLFSSATKRTERSTESTPHNSPQQAKRLKMQRNTPEF
jgi:hypothetical protein